MTKVSNAEANQLEEIKQHTAKERKRTQNRLNQQKSRIRRRNREIQEGKRNASTGELIRQSAFPKFTPSHFKPNIPGLTHHSATRVRKTGKYKQKERVQSDWKAGTTWGIIDAAAHIHNFKARAIVRYLQTVGVR